MLRKVGETRLTERERAMQEQASSQHAQKRQQQLCLMVKEMDEEGKCLLMEELEKSTAGGRGEKSGARRSKLTQ